MPDRLKEGLEGLSGFDLSGVRVHTNSAKPAEVGALAYARGQEIHLGPGQEEHLPHEGWHVVQQMEGRVRPTLREGGLGINDDVGLEREAEMMGGRAQRVGARVSDRGARASIAADCSLGRSANKPGAVQRMKIVKKDLRDYVSWSVKGLEKKEVTLNAKRLMQEVLEAIQSEKQILMESSSSDLKKFSKEMIDNGVIDGEDLSILEELVNGKCKKKSKKKSESKKGKGERSSTPRNEASRGKKKKGKVKKVKKEEEERKKKEEAAKAKMPKEVAGLDPEPGVGVELMRLAELGEIGENGKYKGRNDNKALFFFDPKRSYRYKNNKRPAKVTLMRGWKVKTKKPWVVQDKGETVGEADFPNHIIVKSAENRSYGLGKNIYMSLLGRFEVAEVGKDECVDKSGRAEVRKRLRKGKEEEKEKKKK
ncbi:MAG: DUF4157 domain-containing protein [bacterium]|nr:DUF4157 domain-containing protein [bacterium]